MRIDRITGITVGDIKNHVMESKALSRRDFLKLSGAVAGGTLLAACAPSIVTSPPLQENTVVPEGKTFQGTIDKSNSTKIQADFLSTYVAAGSLGVTKDNSIGFSIDALNQKSDLVLRYSPTESPYKNLFIKTTLGWAEMAQVQIGQNDELYVGIKKETRARMGWVLLYLGGGQSEPVISLTQLEQGDWEKMTDQQRNAYSLIFTPPPDLRQNYSGYDFKKDKIVVTEVQSVGGLVAMPLAVRTPEPTEAPKKEITINDLPERSMATLSKEDSMDDQVQINQAEAQRFYKRYWVDFLNGSIQKRELTQKIAGKQGSWLNLIPNNDFIAFIKTNFGVDPTTINEGNIDTFLDALKNSKKDPNNPNDPGYWVPAGLPMPYVVVGNGVLEVNPAPAFCAKTLILETWTNKAYIQKTLNGGVKNNEVTGMGPEYHRWGQRFVDVNGTPLLALVLTSGNDTEAVFNNPVTQSDVDRMNNNLSLFLTLDKNIKHGVMHTNWDLKQRVGIISLYFDQGDTEGYEDDWAPNNAPQFNVLQRV